MRKVREEGARKQIKTGMRRKISRRDSGEITWWTGLKFSEEQVEAPERTVSGREWRTNKNPGRKLVKGEEQGEGDRRNEKQIRETRNRECGIGNQT